MSLRFANRHVVITGAGTGIGRAIAQRLGSEGAQLTLMGRRRALLEETARVSGGTVVVVDVRSRSLVDAAFASVGPIHALVANAGVGGPNTPGEGDRFEDLVNTNLVGTYHCLRAAQRQLVPGPGFRDLVVTSSILGRFGVPGYTGYCASKTALIGLVRALAHEVAGQNIRVNAICPGWVDTEMARDGIQGMADGMGVPVEKAHAIAMSAVPFGRMGRPEEVAGLVAWLLSEDAGTMTGQALDQNGGAWMG